MLTNAMLRTNAGKEYSGTVLPQCYLAASQYTVKSSEA